MATSVTLPALGESVTEGTVTRWLKQPGEEVQADEPLLEISTDKVDTEIPSPASGVLLEIKVQEDEPEAEQPAEQPEQSEAAEAEQPDAAESEQPAEQPSAASSGEGTPVTLPALGESVTEGTVTRWLKQVGDSVDVDEPLLEISTDKVDTEIPSPVAGTVLDIKVAEDETVEVGAELAVIGAAGAAPAAQPSQPAQPA